MFQRIVQLRFKNNPKNKKRLHYNVGANQDTITAELLLIGDGRQ